MNDAGNELEGRVGRRPLRRGRDLDFGEICGVVDGEVEGYGGEDDDGAEEEEGEDDEGYEQSQPAARHLLRANGEGEGEMQGRYCPNKESY